MVIDIKNISESQLDEFSSILKEAALWLKSNGKEMWSEHQLTRERLLKHNKIEEMFIGFVDNEAAAVMILQEEDDLFWPEESKNESLFLHKLAVRREYAGKGLSQEMIKSAKVRAKNRDKKYLRLDCAAKRQKLCEFYESQGFIKVTEKLMFDKFPTAFYECELS